MAWNTMPTCRIYRLTSAKVSDGRIPADHQSDGPVDPEIEKKGAAKKAKSEMLSPAALIAGRR